MNTFHGRLEIAGSASTVATLLGLVTSLDGDQNYLILTSLDDSKEGYVQFVAAPGVAEVYCEAAGNDFIQGVLSGEGEARLAELGWQPPETGNHFVERSCGTPADRLSIAKLALQTLREVYDWSTGGLIAELQVG